MIAPFRRALQCSTKARRSTPTHSNGGRVLSREPIAGGTARNIRSPLLRQLGKAQLGPPDLPQPNDHGDPLGRGAVSDALRGQRGAGGRLVERKFVD